MYATVCSLRHLRVFLFIIRHKYTTDLLAKSFRQKKSWVWLFFWTFLAQEGKDGGILLCTLWCMEFD